MNVFHKPALAVLAAVLFFFVPAATAVAETITVLSVPFFVESLIEIDSSIVEVRLFGETKLVPRRLLNDFVVKSYLGPDGRGRTFSPETLERFILNALKENRINFASWGLAALLDVSYGRKAKTAEFMEELGGSKEALKVLQGTLLQFGADQELILSVREKADFVAEVVFQAGLQDMDWLRGNAVNWAYSLGEQLRDIARERYAKAVLNGQPDKQSAIWNFLLQLYGSDDKAYQNVRALDEKIAKLQRLRAAGDADGLLALSSDSLRDAFFEKVISPLVLEAIFQQVDSEIAGGRPQEALRLLAKLSNRTPRYFDAVQRGLLRLDPAQTLAGYGEVGKLLLSLSASDPGFERLYLIFLQRQVNHFLERSAPERSEWAFGQLLLLRKDPSKANDAMRIRQAISFLKQDMRVPAFEKLSQVQTGISFYDRLVLEASGLHLSRISRLAIEVLLAVAGLLLLAAHYAGIKRKLDKIRQSAWTMGSQTAHGAPRFMPNFMKNILTPQREEYLRNLAVLGVKPDASIRDIKVAYRKAVKDHHPDAQGSSIKASDEFVKLTDAYEKALTLKEGMDGQEEDGQ